MHKIHTIHAFEFTDNAVTSSICVYLVSLVNGGFSVRNNRAQAATAAAFHVTTDVLLAVQRR